MFANVPMTPEERRRLATEMARLRVAGLSARRSRSHRLPAALPCTDYNKAFAGIEVPMGTVEMTEAAELESWLLVARPVSRKEAEKKGGCIRFLPVSAEKHNSSTSTSSLLSSKASVVKPLYYCITDTDDEVYGRAAYLPRTPVTRAMIKSASAVSQECGSEGNACTDEDEEEENAHQRSGAASRSDSSLRVSPLPHNSCRCVVKA